MGERYKNKDYLVQEYVEKKRSTNEIGDELGVNGATIWYWLDKYGIERRDRIEEAKKKCRVEWANYHTNSHGHPRWKATNGPNNEDVVYVHRLLAIAEYGFEAVVNNDVHHRNNVPWDNRIENLEIMSESEHRAYHNKGNDEWEGENAPWYDEEKLRALYLEKGLSTREIGEEWGCSKTPILDALHRYDIPVRPPDGE